MLIVHKKRILISVAWSLFTLTSTARPQSPHANIGSSIDSILAPWARKSGPGLAALVVDHGRTVYAKGFGLSDVAAKTPIDQNTIFDLGSLTKQFTATAVFLPVRDGKVGLDQPVSKIYSEYAREWFC